MTENKSNVLEDKTETTNSNEEIDKTLRMEMNRMRRIHTVKLLYLTNINENDINKAIESYIGVELEGDFNEDCSFVLSNEIVEQVKNILTNVEEIDIIIENNLTNWNLHRLNKVDLAILRNAVYEMKFTDLPKEVAINEALITTQILTDEGDSKAKKFNNKVLDNIAKNLGV